MNILMGINTKYLMPARVMLTSLLENTREEVKIYLLYNSLEKSAIQSLSEYLCKKYHAELIAIFIDMKDFKEFPLSHHFSVETYFRFLAPTRLPKDVLRVLWLDSDIIIKKSIDEFYNTDFQGNCLVACESNAQFKEPEKHSRFKMKLGLREESIYFNAGVILFNIEKIREEYNQNVFFDYMEKNKDKITWLDQDVLNVIFCDSTKILNSKIYNNHFFNSTRFTKKQLNEIKKETVILHYIGDIKPWQIQCSNPLASYYRKTAIKVKGYPYYYGITVCSWFYLLWQTILNFLRSIRKKIKQVH